MFAGQTLKSKVKSASEEWLRFFVRMSNVFALREGTAQVPGTPENHEDLVTEIREINKRENITQSLWGWNNTIHLLEDVKHADADLFLLSLNTVERRLNVRSYTDQWFQSSGSLEAVRRAYPNYYVDTSGFVRAVENEIGGNGSVQEEGPAEATGTT
jgi:hypothetical protein